MQRRQNKREQLLKAASRVVIEQGYSSLTLEAVATEAGVSKGGLLYHFPSKEALVSGLVERLLLGFEESQKKSIESDRGGPGAWTRAYLRASFHEVTDRDRQEKVSSALIAAIGMDPSLLKPWRDHAEGWVRELDRDGLDGVDAHIVRLAVDGLWLSDLLGMKLSKKLRTQILKRLLELAGGES